MANTTKSIDAILASDELTAYEVYRLWAAAVATVDVNRASELRPQMVYNYTRNGLIAKGKKGSGSVIRYTVTEAQAWIKKWTNKHLTTEPAASPSCSWVTPLTRELIGSVRRDR